MKLDTHKFLALIACLLLVLAGTAACQNRDTETATQEKSEKTARSSLSVADLVSSMNMYYFKEPVKAPAFELTSVEGKTYKLDQYRGKTVLLSFWATW